MFQATSELVLTRLGGVRKSLGEFRQQGPAPALIEVQPRLEALEYDFHHRPRVDYAGGWAMASASHLRYKCRSFGFVGPTAHLRAPPDGGLCLVLIMANRPPFLSALRLSQTLQEFNGTEDLDAALKWISPPACCRKEDVRVKNGGDDHGYFSCSKLF